MLLLLAFLQQKTEIFGTLAHIAALLFGSVADRCVSITKFRANFLNFSYGKSLSRSLKLFHGFIILLKKDSLAGSVFMLFFFILFVKFPLSARLVDISKYFSAINAVLPDIIRFIVNIDNLLTSSTGESATRPNFGNIFQNLL